MLSDRDRDRDREVLELIRRDLIAEDPSFVQRFSASSPPTRSRRDLDRYTYKRWIAIAAASVLSLLLLSAEALSGAVVIAMAAGLVAVTQHDAAENGRNTWKWRTQ